MVAARSLDLEQARRLEKGLVAVRWFGVAFALFQISQDNSMRPRPPAVTQPRGFVVVAVLALGNLAVWLLTRRARELRGMRLIGYAAFALDIAVCLGMVWNYSYWANANSWVIAYILPLEGAIRYQLRGALAATFVSGISEGFREWYLSSAFAHHSFQLVDVTFRVGIEAIIALVAGFMARSLALEAEKAENRAMLAEEAARREAAARREVDLFHTAVLAGVAAEDLEESLQSMAESIGRNLGFEVCTILLCNEDGDELRPVGVYGLPTSVRDRIIDRGEGLLGTVYRTGRPLLTRDVRTLTNYVEFDPRVQAKGAVPLRADGEIIGVLDVETWGQFQEPETTLDLLTRLGDQISMVVHNARLRARQIETLERLSELDRMKSDFVAITSHELRTPLTAIRGFVKTMMRNSDRLSPADMQDFLQIVDRQSHRLARLVEDLLMASKIEAGELSISPEPVAPVGFLASFGENADRISLQMNGDAPDVIVIDPYRVEQILRNLIHNAMKFSPPTSQISLGSHFVDHSIVMSVTDRGVGIAPEEQARVFERFHQTQDSMTREAEGAGLGLYITKRLVEAMGGTIELQSQVGLGSTFTVSIPLEDAPNVDVPESQVVRAD